MLSMTSIIKNIEPMVKSWRGCRKRNKTNGNDFINCCNLFKSNEGVLTPNVHFFGLMWTPLCFPDFFSCETKWTGFLVFMKTLLPFLWVQEGINQLSLFPLYFRWLRFVMFTTFYTSVKAFHIVKMRIIFWFFFALKNPFYGFYMFFTCLPTEDLVTITGTEEDNY